MVKRGERKNDGHAFKETETLELKKPTSELKESIISISAIRAALVNLLCHRDYFRAGSNKVTIFKDRIKIYNSGEFTARYEPSDYMHGDYESVHRNPLISEILYFSKDVDQWGMCIGWIYDEFTENYVKVEFSEENGVFSIIFYRSGVGNLAEAEWVKLMLLKSPRKSGRCWKPALSLV